jgi:hypothetical protein
MQMRATNLMQMRKHFVVFDARRLASSTTVAWGTSRLRIALALDNTGSMSSAGKITALKTATKSLLTMLQNSATNAGDIYVSIIPFSKDVNVGGANFNASWIDWTNWNRNNGTCSTSFTDTGSSQQTDCQNAGGTWTPANHNTWNGCVRDRGTNTAPGINPGYDQKVDPPDAGNTATLFPAEQYAYCPLEMMGLSYSWTTMNTLVDNMFPNGSTNQPIGLVWGWQSLVGRRLQTVILSARHALRASLKGRSARPLPPGFPIRHNFLIRRRGVWRMVARPCDVPPRRAGQKRERQAIAIRE